MIRAFDIRFYSFLSALFQNGAISSERKNEMARDWHNAAAKNDRESMAAVICNVVPDIPAGFVDLASELMAAVEGRGRKE